MAEGMRKVGLAITLSLAIATCASAQGRGGFAARSGAGAHGFSGPGRGFSSGRGFLGPGRAPGIIRTGPGVFRPGLFTHPIVGTPLNPNFAPIFGAPGLGFDFQHLAAIERPFRRQFAFRHGHDGFFPFVPLFFETLPLDYGEYAYPYEYPSDNGYPPSAIPDYYTQGAQQPQFTIPRPEATPPAESTPSAASQTPAPSPPELGQLILVRRDGQVVLAVAFTVRNGELTYITTDGARRSFPVSELDKEATRQMNDANGTSVSLPK